jgi:hypothetical protein
MLRRRIERRGKFLPESESWKIARQSGSFLATRQRKQPSHLNVKLMNLNVCHVIAPAARESKFKEICLEFKRRQTVWPALKSACSRI